MNTTNDENSQAAAGQVQRPRPLAERLRQCADEVMEFPHPSACNHLHCAHDLMREAADYVERDELSPDFTDTARAALLWVLWHHQGGGSPVGQPIRFALGMGAHDPLSPHQVAEAKRWAAVTRSTTAEFHKRANAMTFDALGAPRTRHVRVTLNGSHCVLDAREGDRYVQEARDAGDESEYTVADVYLSEREFDDLPEFGGF